MSKLRPATDRLKKGTVILYWDLTRRARAAEKGAVALSRKAILAARSHAAKERKKDKKDKKSTWGIGCLILAPVALLLILAARAVLHPSSALFWGAVILTGLTGWAAHRAPVIVGLTGIFLIATLVARWLMWPTAITWCIAAWHAGADPKPRNEVSEPSKNEPAPDPAPPPQIDPLLALCAELIGTAHGVHLNALVTRLREAGAPPSTGAAEVRAALAQRGVSTRSSVRAPKGAAEGAPQGVAQGVHRADLEAIIGPLSTLTPRDAPNTVATPTTSPLTCNVAKPATGVAGPVATPVAAHSGPSESGPADGKTPTPGEEAA